MLRNKFVFHFFFVVATFLATTTVAKAASCSFTEANWEINALAGDPTVKALLGSPTSEIYLVPGGDGCFRHFQRGSIYWNPSAGTHYVMGAIRQKWSQLGWETSFLRYPLTNELATPDGAGRFNHFQGGSIYWHPSTGAFEVHGDIRHLWSTIGWERSPLGYPVSDETIAPDRVGRFNVFQNGSIYWKPNLGPHFILGAIRNFWASQGHETNPLLGYPITNELPPVPGSANRFHDFENGVLYWKPASGVSVLGRFPLASRDKAQLEEESQKQLATLMAPYGNEAYIDSAPKISAVTDYTRQGFNTVVNREIQLDMRIKYKAEFLGIDGALPDPYTNLTVWAAFSARKTAAGTDIVMTLTRAKMHTVVPAPTSAFVSAETINAKLKKILEGVIGKPQVMGTLPPSLNVLSVKIMPNGDLNTYIEPL